MAFFFSVINNTKKSKLFKSSDASLKMACDLFWKKNSLGRQRFGSSLDIVLGVQDRLDFIILAIQNILENVVHMFGDIK